MAKKKIDIQIKSWGIYSQWDRSSKALPKITKFTETIPCELDIEFGYILHIKGAKGKVIDFTIKHPEFADKDGNPAPDFEGSYFINSNDYSFFIGDTIWEPIHDKAGHWLVICYMDGKEIAKKTFNLIL